ncbi:uncharacterized protein LOC133181143 [Saccostrea echinata]|uniref:uncharacterized protein LOC133181143 n=1 Tax=Saccostrea echinata TaxID=191078 RepID=UPI002A835C62|nr:uncharacterized protein LOC133181143 [Saccostrea echinata]
MLRVCKSSMWNGITESMIKTSNPSSRKLTNARIDCCNSKTEKGGWCGNSHTTDNWIEVDFDQGVGIRELVIQKPEDAHEGYVMSVSLQFMLKGSTSFQYVSSDPTQPQPIDALRDDTVSTIITINPGLVVTKFRINILTFQKSPCLRFDLLGCTNYEALCPNTCLNGGQCIAENQCACPTNYNGARCENLMCKTALGLASGAITDSMISVSSSATGKSKDKVRYNCCSGEDNGAWCPAPSDHHPWLEVRLTKPMAVSGLNFLHPSQKDSHTYPSMYMETFELKFISAMGPIRELHSYHEHIPSIFNSTLYYNIGLNPYIVTDAIRIYPETYHSSACFRMEVVGCDPAVLCSQDFCKNGGTCMGVNVCKCTHGFYGDSCDKQTSNMVHLNLGFTQIIQHVIHTNLHITLNIHGTATLVNSDSGKAISLTGNSYIIVNNTGFNACLKDIDTCSSGFTLTINVNLHQLTDNTYIVSSGGDLQNHKGIALFYKSHTLHFVVTTSSNQWIVTVPNTLSLNVWHKIELSWSKTSGSLLVIDNNLAGSVSRPQPTLAHQVLPLTIGHGYHHPQVSISMTVSGVQTFDSHRDNLMLNGLVTTPKATTAQQTTTSVSTTTETTTLPSTTTQAGATTAGSTIQAKLQLLPVINRRWILVSIILKETSYNFTVFGKPHLTPEQNGAILELHKDGQYVELPNYGLECIQDMTKCDHGFTLSAEIKLKDMNSTDKRYILSSGGDQVGASGLALYLWHGDLYCSTKKDNYIWTAKQKLNIKAGEWHIYQVSWNKKDGFIVYLDGKVFMSHSIKLPNPDQPTVYPLYIANAPNSTYSSTQMDVRNLYTWSASRDSLIGQGCILLKF